MRKIIYICLLLVLPLAAMAQETPRYSKTQGDEAYAAARYADAIEIYESLLKEQEGNLSRYYNLGNAYYRDNQLGKAILNYERALRIDAADEDAKAKLEFVQNQIVDKVSHDEVPFYKEWWNAFTGIFTKDIWGIWGVVAFIGMLTALFFYFFRSGMRRTSLVVAIVCFVFTVVANFSAHSLNSIYDSAEAIIMDEMVIVKSSPESSGTELTEIHEGLKVKIVDEIEEWVKIESNNGNRVVGWVKAKSLERI